MNYVHLGTSFTVHNVSIRGMYWPWSSSYQLGSLCKGWCGRGFS